MPTLDWIGKKAVINHHKEVPFLSAKTRPPCLSVPCPTIGQKVYSLRVLAKNLFGGLELY